jgi:hypothetical protein
VLGLRWFRDRTPDALARDHGISRAPPAGTWNEVITVLAEQAPDPRRVPFCVPDAEPGSGSVHDITASTASSNSFR